MTVLSRTKSTVTLEQRIASLTEENARLKSVVLRDAQAVAAALQSSQQWLDLLEGSTQALVVHRGGPPLYFNQALMDLLLIEDREAYASVERIYDYVHPDDRSIVSHVVEQFLSGGPIPADGEFRLVRADGSIIWVESHTSTVIWDGTNAVVTAMHDISHRRVAERELRRSRRLFQTAFDACPDLMSLNDLKSGRYVDINHAFLTLTGYERDEVIGHTPVELNIFDTESRSRITEALRGKSNIRDLEIQARDRDGTARDFMVSGKILDFPGQNLALMVARDITKRRQEEQELRRSREAAEQASRSKSQFLAAMSHELRTPLNAIIGFSEIMRDELFGPLGSPQYSEYVRDVLDSGVHLLNIINDLLDLSKLEAGKLELSEDTFEPDWLVEDCLRLVRGRADRGKITLATDVDGDLPWLTADPRLMKQILINLLSNAVKFTPEHGTVTIGATANADGSLDFYVRDTGIGMSPNEIKVALTPFGQVDGRLSRAHEGTGLGLPLARQLTELHGASLRVDSSPGAGTTVTITMPATRIVTQ